MEMTPLQSWFLLYGESIPSPQEARDTFEAVFIEKNKEYAAEGQLAATLDQDEEMDQIARKIQAFLVDSLESAAEEMKLGFSFPHEGIIFASSCWQAAHLLTELMEDDEDDRD